MHSHKSSRKRHEKRNDRKKTNIKMGRGKAVFMKRAVEPTDPVQRSLVRFVRVRSKGGECSCGRLRGIAMGTGLVKE